ncbi:MAG: hypothetical protein ACTSPB_02305 [Candidatus Thorarchaeota archaeon]
MRTSSFFRSPLKKLISQIDSEDPNLQETFEEISEWLEDLENRVERLEKEVRRIK